MSSLSDNVRKIEMTKNFDIMRQVEIIAACPVCGTSQRLPKTGRYLVIVAGRFIRQHLNCKDLHCKGAK